MDMVKAEKERAMLRYRRLGRAAVLSRCLLESLAALALLSWSSDRLPAALAVGAGLLRRLLAVVIHPLSAFVLGNAIVVTLLAKSGDAHPAHDPPPSRYAATVARPATLDVYDNLGHYFYPSSSSAPTPPRHLQRNGEEEDVLYGAKAVCAENTATAASHPKKGRPEPEPEPDAHLCLRWARSEDPAEAVSDKGTEKNLLCRPVTTLGACQKVVAMWEQVEEQEVEEEEGEEGGDGLVVVVDDSVEFRRKIEAFITKQLRFIEREEEELLFAEVSEYRE